MFGLVPKPPISREAKEWLEQAMRSLCGVFGEDFPRNIPVILPTEEFFPDDWDGDEKSSERFLHQVCAHMGVDPQRLMLAFLQDDHEKLRDSMPYWKGESNGAAGLYIRREDQDKIVIAVKLSQRKNLVALVGTMAHELAHVILLADGKLPADTQEKHMEPLTDLYTVFCGLGLCTANSATNFVQYDDGTKHGWSFQTQGYLSEPMFGYALALFAALRNEAWPAWAKYLNVNVGAYFKQSAKVIAYEGARRRTRPESTSV